MQFLVYVLREAVETFFAEQNRFPNISIDAREYAVPVLY